MVRLPLPAPPAAPATCCGAADWLPPACWLADCWLALWLPQPASSNVATATMRSFISFSPADELRLLARAAGYRHMKAMAITIRTSLEEPETGEAFIPHRPPRPDKAEGGKRFNLVSDYRPPGDQPQA